MAKDRKIVAPSGYGTYAVLPTSAEFYPEFTPLKVEPSYPLVVREAGAYFKKVKGKVEEIYKPELKMVKGDIRTLKQKMPEWFPGLKEMRREATRERIRLKEKEGLKLRDKG